MEVVFKNLYICVEVRWTTQEKKVNFTVLLIFKIKKFYVFIFKILFIYSWERQKERERERERGVIERERKTEGKAVSMQGAWRGTRSQVSRIMPWAEGALNRWATQAAQESVFYLKVTLMQVILRLHFKKHCLVCQSFLNKYSIARVFYNQVPYKSYKLEF